MEGVRAEGSKRLTRICDRQADAIAVGVRLPTTYISELRVQVRDDRFREAWSYGTIRSPRDAELIPTPPSGPRLVQE